MDQDFEAFDCVHCSHYKYQPEDSYIEEQDVYACELGIYDNDDECRKNFIEG